VRGGEQDLMDEAIGVRNADTSKRPLWVTIAALLVVLACVAPCPRPPRDTRVRRVFSSRSRTSASIVATCR
jgi:hypothetical protein